ncbi:MAG: aminopeptidase P family protein [Armatimonadetes bacterium]|nr:aminopeptidase P family protein [Armatimonadota bacterium]
MTDFEQKLARVRALLQEQGLDGAVFGTVANFAWLTGGADNHVGITSDNGNAAAVVTPSEVFVVTDNIEAPRLRDEETVSLGLEVVEFPWWEPDLTGAVTQRLQSQRWASDMHTPGQPDVEPLMYRLRAELTVQEVQSYRELGRITGLALQRVGESVEVGQSEHEIAGKLAGALYSKGVIASVILVAADERISLYRHPVPTAKRIEKACMLVVGARWKGLICSCTRIVHFGKLPEELARKHQAVCEVDAAFLSHTLPGETIGDAVKAGFEAYAARGYPEEWKLHHQGGPTGYKGREFRATQSSPQRIAPLQPFAWNPSITGAKSEDTVLASEPWPDVLTVTPEWPIVDVQTPSGWRQRADILVK